MIIKQKEKVELHGRRDFIYPSEQIRIAIRNKSGFQGWEGDISKLSTFCNCGHQYAYFQTEEFQFMNDIWIGSPARNFLRVNQMNMKA